MSSVSADTASPFSSEIREGQLTIDGIWGIVGPDQADEVSWIPSAQTGR